jgi:hypothetical protein
LRRKLGGYEALPEDLLKKIHSCIEIKMFESRTIKGSEFVASLLKESFANEIVAALGNSPASTLGKLLYDKLFVDEKWDVEQKATGKVYTNPKAVNFLERP